jgi:hypothetical protein
MCHALGAIVGVKDVRSGTFEKGGNHVGAQNARPHIAGGGDSALPRALSRRRIDG